MPGSSTSAPPPSSSPKLWLILGAVALAAIAGLYLLMRTPEPADTADPAAQQDPEAPPEERRNKPSPGPRTIEAPELGWATAAGRVTAAGGEAIASALVTLAPLDDDAGEPRTTTTDAGGSWSLTELPAGRYTLSATAPGYLAGVRPDLKLRPKSDNPGLDLSLEPGGATLSGVVSDKTGGVIEGALVAITPSSGIVRMRERESYFTLSDAEGRYAVQVPDGRHRVRASHSDYSSEAAVLELAGEPTTQDFALVPTAVIEGVVLRESDGAPVPFAEVTWKKSRDMMLPGGGRATVFERGGGVTADGEGRFRVSGVPPGMLRLSARASQLASFEDVELPIGIAERVADVELRLAAAQDVRGRVVARADGSGVAEAEVMLVSQLGSGRGVTTDEQGAFELLGVLPGSYQVVAEAEGYAQGEGGPTSVEVGGDAASSVLIELERALTIQGRVEPAVHAEVSIELDAESLSVGRGGMMMLQGMASASATAATGNFELGPVNPGRYTLQARTADGRGGSIEVEVGPEGARDVVIPLEPRAVLAGRVEDFGGKPVGDVTVRARKRKAASSLSVVVNGRELTALSGQVTADGSFELSGLDAGPWFIEVVDPQGEPLALDVGARLELELTKGERRELVLRVEPRDGVIAGTVRDSEGNPAADAWVSAAFVPGPGPEPEDESEGGEPRHEMRMMVVSDDGGASSWATRPPVLTDADGRFRFEGLRAGEYLISAELDGGASKATLEGVRPNAEITLDLAPLGTIEGTVTSDGQAADCVVSLSGPTQRRIRVRDGSFELERLEPGTYTVEARAPDGSVSTQAQVEAGSTAEVRLVLERLVTIRGKIVDESGAPIVGAEIMIGGGDGGRVEISREDGDPQYFTNEQGEFEARAAAGARVLIAQAKGVPMPIVIKPFVASSGKDVDLGELRKQDMKGMMMMGGPDDAPGGHPEE